MLERLRTHLPAVVTAAVVSTVIAGGPTARGRCSTPRTPTRSTAVMPCRLAPHPGSGRASWWRPPCAPVLRIVAPPDTTRIPVGHFAVSVTATGSPEPGIVIVSRM
jgi:hypothetical protein